MLCYRLGRARGGLWDGGANLFSASCIPADAPPSLPHSYFVLFNVSVSKNVAVAFRADRVGLHIDSNGNQIKTEMSLMVKFARTRGARGNNMRVGYVDQRSFKLIYIQHSTFQFCQIYVIILKFFPNGGKWVCW